jgi:ankyrin repeat protein
LLNSITSSFCIKITRKKAQRKQETTLVPHRTPNLSVLLGQAETGDSADAVKAYLDAGGSAVSLIQLKEGRHLVQLPLLHNMAVTNAHPHKELAESVKLLIDAGADVNAETAGLEGSNYTALMCAAERTCCTTVLDVLLQASANACVRTVGERITALHAAAASGLADGCELLVRQAHVLLELRDVSGWTALMYAAHCGYLEVVQLLLQHSADINAVDSKGSNALMKAARTSNIAVAQLLLDSGADISATDTVGHNALFGAVFVGNVTMMEMLVQRGLSVQAVDNKGCTLLITAAAEGRTQAAEWLLQQGVAVDAYSEDVGTALHVACGSSSSDDATMAELLLASGASVHQYAKERLTALDLALRSGNVQCTKALIAAGADVNRLNCMHMTGLHIALFFQHAAVVQLLLETGAAAVINVMLNRPCKNGVQCCSSRTALMMCTEADTVKLLLAAGANVHVTNEAGDTCLHVAAKHN